MKKIKLLTPIFGLTAICSTVVPMMTSCSNSTRTIPTNLLETLNYTLKGLTTDADVSNYNTLSIPEGIKHVDNNAFKGQFAVGQKNGTIRTIVFPKSARTIRAGAFDGCDSLRVLDFSAWTVDEINDATFATTADDYADAFNDTAGIGKVVMNSNLTEQSKKTLKEKLIAAGLSEAWFAEEAVNEKVVADKAWMEQKVKGGSTNYLFKLTDKLPQDTQLYAVVTKTSGTKGVDVTTPIKPLTINDQLVVELPVELMNQENDGDYVQFDVAFAAVKGNLGPLAETLWTQTIKGFKLTNVVGEKVAVESITINATKKTLSVNEVLPLEVKVLPEDATNKNYELSSSNTNVATVDENGIKGVAAGTAKITATAKDGSGVTGTIDVTVEESGAVVISDWIYDETEKQFTSNNHIVGADNNFTLKINSSSELTWSEITIKENESTTGHFVDGDANSFSVYIISGSQKESWTMKDTPTITNGNVQIKLKQETLTSNDTVEIVFNNSKPGRTGDFGPTWYISGPKKQ